MVASGACLASALPALMKCTAFDVHAADCLSLSFGYHQRVGQRAHQCQFGQGGCQLHTYSQGVRTYVVKLHPCLLQYITAWCAVLPQHSVSVTVIVAICPQSKC